MTSLADNTYVTYAPPKNKPRHEPVMIEEVLLSLAPVAGDSFIDCNAGEGGHTEAILKSARNVRVLGIDLDYDALSRVSKRLSSWTPRLNLHHGNFSDVYRIADLYNYAPASGVLFDLGMSSAQLDAADRGFSFRSDGLLDMRFDQKSGISARDIVNRWPEERLEKIIHELGEEPRAGRVARNIVRNRPIDTTFHLADVVIKALNWPTYSRVHPATRTFQALRMAVNGEKENLESGLEGAVKALKPGGRLVTLSYHSIEDRIVKNFIRRKSASCLCPPVIPECVCDKTPELTPVNKRVYKPLMSEINKNPRARSARMRVAERI